MAVRQRATGHKRRAVVRGQRQRCLYQPRDVHRLSGRSTLGRIVPAACTSRVLLPLMQRKFDNPSAGLAIVRVQIERCRNG